MVLVFLSPARRKRDLGAAAMSGDRMWGWSCSETGRVAQMGLGLGYRSTGDVSMSPWCDPLTKPSSC